MSQPRITYSGRVVDLAQVGGFDHEGVEVGDVVTLIDDEQDIECKDAFCVTRMSLICPL